MMGMAQIGKVYAQLDPPLWLVTAADGGRRGGLIATTVAQASIGPTGSPLLPEALGWFDCRVEARMDSGDRTVYLAAVVDGRLERPDPPLTNRRFFELAPPDKQKIMDEQYEHDARLDTLSIQRWRDERVKK
jgi:flavin reductase (DIM6/NTAB) family NADH-FMN oxidoreductase RutF